MIYGRRQKISYTKLANKMAYTNSADPVQEQSDQGLHCFLLHQVFEETTI